MLFDFLRKNKKINRKIQEGFILESLSPTTVSGRALLLMHHALQTQSQPKLDYILEFLKSVAGTSAIGSCENFRHFLTHEKKTDLCLGLSQRPGWGKKTAALFVRNLALINQSPTLRSHFWQDIDVMHRNEIYLPVDKVITAVFYELMPILGRENLNTFDRINSYLRHELAYNSKDMLIWDDLWFWGFITQKSTIRESARTHGWNEAKYWGIPHASKEKRAVACIEKKSNEFLTLLGHKNLPIAQR